MDNYPGLKRFRFYLLTGGIWLLLWIFNSFINHPRTFQIHALNEVWLALYLIIANFIFFEYGLPFIKKKRPAVVYNILYGVLFVSIYLASLSFGLFGWTYLGKLSGIYTALMEINLEPDDFYNEMMFEVSYLSESGIASAFFFGIAYLLDNNFRLKLKTQRQHLEMREAELNYLKSQTNPHFLFNTLNNIYGLATIKSDIAPESILRLSKILRFMLYETGSEFITIQQEVEVIRDYIALEELRYDDSLKINFTCAIPDLMLYLPPLLLIPLIENAFKHGVAENIGNPFVDIDLTVIDNEIALTVKNSSEGPETSIGKENIGLSNLRRQLQLLYTNHELSLVKEKEIITATLKIDLTSHVHDKMHHN
ncbi:MAG: sensor histidine kinase [Flavitalea sp.]